MKNKHILQKKKISENIGIALAKVLQTSLIPGFIEDSWILIFTTAFSLLWYVILVEYMKEIYFYRDMYLENGRIFR